MALSLRSPASLLLLLAAACADDATDPSGGGDIDVSGNSPGAAAAGGVTAGGADLGGSATQGGSPGTGTGGASGSTGGGAQGVGAGGAGGAAGDGGRPALGGAPAGGSGGTNGGGTNGGGTNVGGTNVGGDGGGTGGAGEVTCPLPSTFQWTSTGPLAEPQAPGGQALKDFSVTKYNGKYIVYGTVPNGAWNGFFSTFESFDDWKTADQAFLPGVVAPTIFYFSPKDVWVLAYQWGFKYATSKTPDDPTSWSATQPLINYNPDATGGAGVGPIDQTIICDDTDCYIFYNDDAGGVYRGSMPIASFPGKFENDTKILQRPTSELFEGVQVYKVKGSDQYLMIFENVGTRFFRAYVATSLDGEWAPLAGASTPETPFAGQVNVTWPDGQWTSDISHGDLVREDPSEKMIIDPCNLQMLYQGRDPDVGADYIDRPYRAGLLTLVRD